jgi:hypothetical protein
MVLKITVLETVSWKFSVFETPVFDPIFWKRFFEPRFLKPFFRNGFWKQYFEFFGGPGAYSSLAPRP